jgi:hypothetical protein
MKRALRFAVIGALAIAAFAVARSRREMVDFEVYHTAGRRALAADPLYVADDGHYQFKYLPAFAVAVAPLSILPEETGKFVWFMMTVALVAVLITSARRVLPDRRRSERLLMWVTLLLIGKFLVRELIHGQTNVLFTAVVVLALAAAMRGRPAIAGALVGAAMFVKPYAIVLWPWLAASQGLRALVPAAAVTAALLFAPAVVYGWDGNLALLAAWYHTTTGTTPENLLYAENISFAAMWQRWLGPGSVAARLAIATGVAALAVAASTWLRRSRVTGPDYLEVGLLLLLVPLLSPQGWDYVLLMGTPAFMLLVDRWPDFGPASKAAIVAGFAVTSFAIFDLYGRTVYNSMLAWSLPAVGATVLLVMVASLRWRGRA